MSTNLNTKESLLAVLSGVVNLAHWVEDKAYIGQLRKDDINTLRTLVDEASSWLEELETNKENN